MKTKIYATVVWLGMVVIGAMPTQAQDVREVPTSAATVNNPYAVGAQAFVEDADPAGNCDCQIVTLRDRRGVQTETGTPTFSPYSGWTKGYTTIETTADVLIVDVPSGTGWLVHTTPVGTVPLLPALTISEQVEVIYLRPGVRWESADLDGDGRDDLIGYLRHPSGYAEVIRNFRRGK